MKSSYSNPTLATVVAEFIPNEPNQLLLKVGDLVSITDQSGDFWEGKCNGISGTFPASSVVIKPSLKPPPQRSMGGAPKSPSTPHLNTSNGALSYPSMAPTPQNNRIPSPISTRPIPKLSEILVDDDDDPTPPPRSPPSSPRLPMLPALPTRPEIKVEVKDEVQQQLQQVAPPPGKKSQADLRKDCLKEIFQTEKDYIEDLETIISVFIFPLRAMQVIPENTLLSIFSNVEVFINCNKEMLKELEEKMAASISGDEVQIGKVFAKLADYFKMYKMYCANQSNSLTTVDYQLRKTPQFKKNLEICHSDPRCKGLTLQSFLIKPIQRVCKYPLLIRELIRHTPEGHPDFESLQSAFSKINEVVININEGQREAENLQYVLDLQKQIDGIDTLVAPGRRLHKEGDLNYYKNQKSKHGERRHVFFFSDLILLTVKKGDKKYEAKLSVPLDSCKIIVVGDSTHIKNAFELSHSKTQCILSSETSEETGQWVKEIKYLIKEVYQKKALELKKKGLNSSVSGDQE